MRTLAATATLALGSAARVHACAVCFGKTDANKGLVDGFWWGIVVLLSCTMGLVAAIALTLWKVERRRAAAEAK